jgi:hypothetical protein
LSIKVISRKKHSGNCRVGRWWPWQFDADGESSPFFTPFQQTDLKDKDTLLTSKRRFMLLKDLRKVNSLEKHGNQWTQ